MPMRLTQICTGLLAASLLLLPAAPALAAKRPSAAPVMAIPTPTPTMTTTTTTTTSNGKYRAEDIRVVGAERNTPAIQDLLASYNDLAAASNRHAIDDLLKHYSPQFISGDNMTLAQIKAMVLETWKSYPDISYDSQPVEIRLNGDWATIETHDYSRATAPPDKDIMNVPGKLVSESRTLLFFRKTGTVWEITSDSTLWEQAIIRFGIGEEVPIVLSAPDQVKAGESYSAVLYAPVPESTFSIGSIDNQPLVYPYEKVEDKFRSLNEGTNDLRRVMTANKRNHNEIVTATIGLSNVTQKNDRPSLSINGIATVVKRVNVVPVSAEDALEAVRKGELVKTTAAGKPPTEEQPAGESDGNPSGSFDLELAPSSGGSVTPNPDTDTEDNGEDATPASKKPAAKPLKPGRTGAPKH